MTYSPKRAWIRLMLRFGCVMSYVSRHGFAAGPPR